MRCKYTQNGIMLGALILGALLLNGLSTISCSLKEHPAHDGHTQAKAGTLYICPMHPNITAKKPGSCPICGMDLVIAETETKAAPNQSNTAGVPGYAEVTIDPQRQQYIGVTLGTVSKRNLLKRVRAVGRVSNDPELYNAQQEYITALKHYHEMKSEVAPEVAERSKSMASSARFKLKLLGLNDAQIDAIGNRAEPDVSLLNASGQSSAWVYAQIYEFDLSYIRAGQTALISIPASGGRELVGTVQSIDPILDSQTRSARARIYIANTRGLLRSESYVNVNIAIPVGNVLAIPENAVLDTGTRTIVFIDKGEGRFEPREVIIGEKVDCCYVVRSGVKEGERLVTSANFLIDSESQLKAAIMHMSGTQSN